MTVTAEDPFGNIDTGFSGTVSVSIVGRNAHRHDARHCFKRPGRFSTTSRSIPRASSRFWRAATRRSRLSRRPRSWSLPQRRASSCGTASRPARSFTTSRSAWRSLSKTSIGNLETNIIGTVSIAFVNNPTGANLGGDTTVDLVSGVASFTTLSISTSATVTRFRDLSGYHVAGLDADRRAPRRPQWRWQSRYSLLRVSRSIRRLASRSPR